jgi:hypothetical protein
MSLASNTAPIRVGIMQPYFLPHLSYFQLIANTDVFCLHDKVKYTKQSWINRNRIVVNGRIDYITIPIHHRSDFDLVDEKQISPEFKSALMLKTIELNYKKSPNFDQVFPLITEIINYKSLNLFEFLENSIIKLSRYLEIKTKIIKSSDSGYDLKLSKSQMVLDICNKLKANVYLNSEGGIELYKPSHFLENGIFLRFSKQIDFSYINSFGQVDASLSVLDALMWADKTLLIHKLSAIEFWDL